MDVINTGFAILKKYNCNIIASVSWESAQACSVWMSCKVLHSVGGAAKYLFSLCFGGQ